MKNILAISLLVLLASCTPKTPTVKMEGPWVFRSVLDQQARMVTAELHDSLWVAYDAQEAQLYKAWNGTVSLDGAVYTTVHGPQPTSVGHPYFLSEGNTWILLKDGQEISPSVSYKGHRIEGNVVSFSYELSTPDGEKIQVQESPAYTTKEGKGGLERTFSVENSTDYQIGLRTNLGYLQAGEDVGFNGNLTIEKEEKHVLGKVAVTHIQGLVSLANGENTLTTFFHPDYKKIEVPGSVDEQEQEKKAKGIALIDGSDCRACHNEELKTVGPSYLSIAKKYNEDDATIDMLINRIIKGASGVWGPVMMTPHPDLMPNDAREMVRYILSLDDDLVTPFDKFALGEKSVPINLSQSYEGESGNGFMAHLYRNDEGLDFLEAAKTLSPVMQGVVSKIHVLDTRDFSGVLENLVVEFEGALNIEKDGSYDFRLISDDGSYLYIDEQLIIDNGGYHGPEVKDGEMYLKAGSHPIKVIFGQGGGGAMVSLQWFDRESESFVLLDDNSVSFSTDDIKETKEYIPEEEESQAKPGDAAPLIAVHPSFDLFQARPDDFTPKVGGIDFLADGRMLVCTWDSLGAVYIVDNWQSGKPAKMSVKQIARGLAEPLGLKVVGDEIYVLQKQELTQLIDLNGDEIVDEYRTVSDKWRVSANFHEFAFGLVFKDGHFYATLATAILPGGASADPQIQDRGKVVKINKETGDTEFIAYGLRTPNGIGLGTDSEIFVADNQGDWLPASKIVHVKEKAFYGSRSVDFEGTEGVSETLPVAWLPQDEIGNSPSTPVELKVGPYAGQMIHGEVTNGGIKRVFVEKVNGQYQGALFRFSQGLEAGVNRLLWAPDGSLMVGGVGSSGNWSHTGKFWYGLQRMVFNNTTTFEMLKVSALANGFEITFTEPIAENEEINVENLLVQQWRYQPTAEYGGPKLDQEDLTIKNFRLSDDRTKIIVELPGIKENHMVYFRVVKPFKSASGQDLWSTECWYTLNEIPDGELVMK